MTSISAHHPPMDTGVPIATIATTGLPSSQSEVVIRQLNDPITLFSRPFSRGGMHVGVRMAAIKTLKGLVLYNPTQNDLPTSQELTKLGGNVTHIIAPNQVHHLWLEEMAKAYPNAKIVLPEGMKEKHALASDRLLELQGSHHQTIDFGDSSLDLCYLPDTVHKEILLFHSPSKTLFCADVLFNLPATEQYQNASAESKKGGIISSIADTYAKPEAHGVKMMNWMGSKKSDAFEQQMIKVFDIWMPTTIVPQHGDVITTNAMERLRNAFSWAWPEKK